MKAWCSCFNGKLGPTQFSFSSTFTNFNNHSEISWMKPVFNVECLLVICKICKIQQHMNSRFFQWASGCLETDGSSQLQFHFSLQQPISCLKKKILNTWFQLVFADQSGRRGTAQQQLLQATRSEAEEADLSTFTCWNSSITCFSFNVSPRTRPRQSLLHDQTPKFLLFKLKSQGFILKGEDYVEWFGFFYPTFFVCIFYFNCKFAKHGEAAGVCFLGDWDSHETSVSVARLTYFIWLLLGVHSDGTFYPVLIWRFLGFFSSRPGAQQMSPPAFPSYSLYSPQQLLWLQHIYARQYYMQ